MRYRVDGLAAETGVSVDTIRFYQSQGLLPQPFREGRVAWYTEEHLERIERIKDLKHKGFTLRSIARLLAGELDPADEALVEAVALSLPGERGGAGVSLTLEELAASTGVSPTLLEAIDREGLLSPVEKDGLKIYSDGDAEIVRAGLSLLETGLPLSELLALAREHDAAMRRIAERAVEMFLDFVRDPIRASSGDDLSTGSKLVEAFQLMLPATTKLVAGHFRALVLAEARRRIEQEDTQPEPGMERVGADGGVASS
ncbi:MAG: MerR family transcriptional regulator [Actinomycetota bacterium]